MADPRWRMVTVLSLIINDAVKDFSNLPINSTT